MRQKILPFYSAIVRSYLEYYVQICTSIKSVSFSEGPPVWLHLTSVIKWLKHLP